MRFTTCICLALVLAAFGCEGSGAAKPDVPAAKEALRAPSVPLVACDPYFSIWSPADKLTDAATVHWTGKRHSLSSIISIDGKTYRLMGAEPKDIAPLPQKSVDIYPTRTVYVFANPQAEVKLTFMTPILPDDLDVLSWPVTFVTWDVRSLDGKRHKVEVSFEAAAEIAVNTPQQKVQCDQPAVPGFEVRRVGSVDQNILGKRGDDLRIDWGYLYLAAPKDKTATSAVRNGDSARDIAIGIMLAMGEVGGGGTSKHLILAYDDLYSIKYFSARLRPYWRRSGAEAADLLTSAEKQYAKLQDRCREFDVEMMADLTRVGGEKYARIAALAYRQCLAANKLTADANGQPILFPKENFSNGCIATVDVIYPMAPQFVLTSPALAKASIVNIMDYASSPRWNFPFAPHDLGQYPFAGGQVYGGGERTEDNQMPVEESGNMLILLAAIAKTEGNANFSAKYWPVITKWAEYLKSKGFDPENQLCTDDFAGHLAHNVNLSAKAIVGLGAYAQLAAILGKKDEAQAYRKLAEEFAAQWVKMADDGDHYRLAYDKPGTWSQKYNLVWDHLLGLNLFPPAVVKKEMAFYRKVQNKFGLPLDSRKTYTKLDWITWTATLTGDRGDFEALIEPIYAFLNQTPNRVPMTDWFETTNARHVGFQARSVVGGVFIKMLDDPATWKKWAARGANVPLKWADLPKPPQVKPMVATAQGSPTEWKYTTALPPADWFKADFDDATWQTGRSGFGTAGTPGAIVNTTWNTPDIWIRRQFEIPAGAKLDAASFSIHHDEDAEVYINGVLAARVSGYTTDYDSVDLTPQGKAALKAGKNTIAVHCHQTTGGQYIDVGLVEVR